MTELQIDRVGPRPATAAPGPSLLRPLLRQPETAADLTRRGTVFDDPAREARLTEIGRRFVRSYNLMLGPDPLGALDRALGAADADWHGFMVEGAAMGAGLRDATSLRGGLLAALRARHGPRFDYMIHVGAGWAMARAPWRGGVILRALDPLLTPLMADGRGFHDVYFDPSAAAEAKTPRGSDAGVGRALWFVSGARMPRTLALLRGHAPDRLPELIAGLGLALGYAGPATEADWSALLIAHPDCAPALAQGLCFAAEARRLSDGITDNLERGCAHVLGLDAAGAARIARDARPARIRTEAAPLIRRRAAS